MKNKGHYIIKKTPLFLMALSTIALASCSDDEPVSSRQDFKTTEAISFRPATRLSTRATETNNSNLSKIFVSAFYEDQNYFNNVEFSKGADSFFTSAEKYQWIGSDSTLNFYAYSPSQDDLGADITLLEGKGGIQLEGYSPSEDISEQVDFITANAKGNGKDNRETGVELTFDHRLSQIEVRAKSENTTYTYKVIGMRIGRAENKATFDFTTNQWTLDDWHQTSIYESKCDTITLNATAQSIMGPSGNAMLLPQTLYAWMPTDDPDNVARDAYLSVLVRITTNESGMTVYPFPYDKQIDEATGKKREYAWASIPLSGTWEQGKHYIYTLDFTNGAGNVDPDDPTPGLPVLGGEIKFTVKVNDWVDGDKAIPMTPTYK